MSHQPWTREDAEKWAMESDVVRKATFEDDAIEGFKAGMAKAAEMIEAEPTVYAATMADLAWHRQHFEGYGMRANLVGVRPIEGSEK